MIYPIKLYGDPILRKKSSPITVDYPNLKKMIIDMYETMHRAKGAGLSAIQIGIPIRLFVIEAHIEKENFHFRETFINPVIHREWGKSIQHPEGCLSIPGLTAVLERPENLEISYLDGDFENKTKIFGGFEARIIQHEYDHLEGKLYTDHLPHMWNSLLEKPLELIEKGIIKPEYLT
jgi:peptide deformylase